MYNIIINGEIVATVILPCYVFYDRVLESFCTCDEDKAEAVLVGPAEGEAFYADIDTKEFRHEGFPVATIAKIS